MLSPTIWTSKYARVGLDVRRVQNGNSPQRGRRDVLATDAESGPACSGTASDGRFRSDPPITSYGSGGGGVGGEQGAGAGERGGSARAERRGCTHDGLEEGGGTGPGGMWAGASRRGAVAAYPSCVRPTEAIVGTGFAHGLPGPGRLGG